MRLYVLRHATAEAESASGRDADRALVDEGHAESSLAARALVQLQAAPVAVVTSPYRRAVETARPVAALLDAPLVEDRRLQPGLDPADLAGVLDAHAAHGGDLVVVGHEPDLSALLQALTGARVDFPKGGLARLDLDPHRPGSSTLRWFLRPKQIRLIAATKAIA